MGGILVLTKSGELKGDKTLLWPGLKPDGPVVTSLLNLAKVHKCSFVFGLSCNFYCPTEDIQRQYGKCLIPVSSIDDIKPNDHRVLIVDNDVMASESIHTRTQHTQAAKVPFKNRADIFFWRGRYDGSTVKMKLVCNTLYDAKFTIEQPQRNNSCSLIDHTTPSLDTFLANKYIFSVNGDNGWTFGGGSVSLCVGDKDFWFEQASPWIHYVPIKSDLSDLEEHLAVLQFNAEGIADNARRLASKICTPDFIAGAMIEQVKAAIKRT